MGKKTAQLRFLFSKVILLCYLLLSLSFFGVYSIIALWSLDETSPQTRC